MLHQLILISWPDPLLGSKWPLISLAPVPVPDLTDGRSAEWSLKFLIASMTFVNWLKRDEMWKITPSMSWLVLYINKIVYKLRQVLSGDRTPENVRGDVPELPCQHSWYDAGTGTDERAGTGRVESIAMLPLSPGMDTSSIFNILFKIVVDIQRAVLAGLLSHILCGLSKRKKLRWKIIMSNMRVRSKAITCVYLFTSFLWLTTFRQLFQIPWWINLARIYRHYAFKLQSTEPNEETHMKGLIWKKLKSPIILFFWCKNTLRNRQS